MAFYRNGDASEVDATYLHFTLEGSNSKSIDLKADANIIWIGTTLSSYSWVKMYVNEVEQSLTTKTSKAGEGHAGIYGYCFGYCYGTFKKGDTVTLTGSAVDGYSQEMLLVAGKE